LLNRSIHFLAAARSSDVEKISPNASIPTNTAVSPSLEQSHDEAIIIAGGLGML